MYHLDRPVDQARQVSDHVSRGEICTLRIGINKELFRWSGGECGIDHWSIDRLTVPHSLVRLRWFGATMIRP